MFQVKSEQGDDIETLKRDILNFQWSMGKLSPELAGQPGALEKFKEDLFKPGIRSNA